jgi:hypothetical protein
MIFPGPQPRPPADDPEDREPAEDPFAVTAELLETNGWEHVYPGYAGKDGGYRRGGTPGGW